MSFLIFPALETAHARSAMAWLDCGYEAVGTYMLWLCIAHPTNGGGALMIPDTPLEAQIGLSQQAYDALLTEAEKAMLVDVLPADWIPEEYR